MSAPAYLEFLRTEFSRRQQLQPRYSLRAFARALGMEPSSLSQIMAGTRIPSTRVAKRVVEGLDLAPDAHLDYWRSLASRKQSQGLKRVSPQLRRWSTEENPLAPPSAAFRSKDLSLDIFRTLGDWYHYAILELTTVKGFQPNLRWVAHQLSLEPTETRAAVDRLVELGLLEISEKGWRKTNAHLATADQHTTTQSHRRRQRQILEKSIYSLENDPIEQRAHRAMTMAVDARRIPEAQRRIQAFQRELCLFLEGGDQKDRVYELQTSLFPLQVKEKAHD